MIQIAVIIFELLYQLFLKMQCALYLVYFVIFNLQSFEALSERAVAVVVDPIQSVKGKVY